MRMVVKMKAFAGKAIRNTVKTKGEQFVGAHVSPRRRSHGWEPFPSIDKSGGNDITCTDCERYGGVADCEPEEAAVKYAQQIPIGAS